MNFDLHHRTPCKLCYDHRLQRVVTAVLSMAHRETVPRQGLNCGSRIPSVGTEGWYSFNDLGAITEGCRWGGETTPKSAASVVLGELVGLLHDQPYRDVTGAWWNSSFRDIRPMAATKPLTAVQESKPVRTAEGELFQC